MNLTIEHLADHPDHVLALARWFQLEWGDLRPEETLESRASRLNERKSKTEMPMTFVALKEQTLVATYSLVLEELKTHPHLSPWLSSVYVDQKVRGQGIGSHIVKDALSRAREMKISRLYLQTNNQVAWYETFGWRQIEKIYRSGLTATIMKIELE